jgi:predicted acyl esterase
MAVPNAIVPILGQTLTGVDAFPAYQSRFAGMTYEDALAAFETEPKVRIHFEEGAADGQPAGSPLPRFVAEFPSWPIPTAVATNFFLGSNGLLVAEGGAVGAGETTYRNDPNALPASFYPGGRSSAIWLASTTYDWRPLPAGAGAGFVTPPLAADTVIAGSGSVDLWITADVDGAPMDDTDLEVTISEVRPDGTEVYVQSGWLRASQRALDDEASTELRPVHTHREEDAAPLEEDEPTPVRIEIFPFAHVFRAGTQIRLTVDAPGNARAVWEFATTAYGENVTIVHTEDFPSKIVLPVVPALENVTIPPTLPVCTSLRGQPCRQYVPADNGG